MIVDNAETFKPAFWMLRCS